MSGRLVRRTRFLDDDLRARLIADWRASLLGHPPDPALDADLPPPWPEVRARGRVLLSPWRALTLDRPEAAERVLELLVARVHKAAWAAQRDPEHPSQSPLYVQRAEVEALPPEDLLRAAPALLQRLCQEARGGWGRFGALIPLAEGLLAQDPESIELTENRTSEIEALRAAILERWDQARAEEVAAFEAQALRRALSALEPELERRREAIRRITRLVGVGLEAVTRGADWSSGFWRPETFRVLEDIAARLEANPSLSQLAEQLGRYEEAEGRVVARERAAAQARRQLRPHRAGASEITGLHRSGDLDRLTAADLALLADPDTELLFYARLLERQLLTYEMRGEAWFEEPLPTRQLRPERPPQRGPVVLCLDTSASMQGAPEAVAKALTLAVLRVALRERRPCHLIQFSSANDLRELELSRFPAALEPLVDFLAGAFYGGTDPRPALERALERVEEGPFTRADILLVSDGVFELDPAFLQRLERARGRVGLRICGLIVGAHGQDPAFGFTDRSWRWTGGDGLEGAAELVRDLRGSGPQSERQS
ncbi:MAG: hypothetical protein H6741_21325 [Alphaproteobacteria bacterium]|nr:hypothetical protein [Alphaproteobacteria bacterium]